MKRVNIKSFSIAVILGASLTLGACKNKNKDADTKVEPAPVETTTPAPVEISADDSLKTGVTDATKDFPGVTAEVSNGEITLRGEIERSRLVTLMQSLNSLRPKKINNNLKVK